MVKCQCSYDTNKPRQLERKEYATPDKYANNSPPLRCKYIITYDKDISHVKLRLWWTCFDRHAHGDMNHVLKSINKYQLDDMIGYRAINPKNKTEVYQLIISDKTGTVILIKPHKIIKFIFGKFELNYENFKNQIAVYSLVTWHTI